MNRKVLNIAMLSYPGGTRSNERSILMALMKMAGRLVAAFLAAVVFLCSTGVAAADDAGASLEITEIRAAGNGSLKITWSDPQNNAPYRILFQPVTEASEDGPTNELFVWCNSGEIQETTYTENYTVRDASWWFVVADSAGNQTVGKYEAQECSFENAWALEFTGRSQKAVTGASSTSFDDTGNDKLGYPVLNTEDVVSAPDKISYGIRLTMKCRNSAAYGQYLAKYVISTTFPGMAKDNSPMVVGLMTDTSRPLVFSQEYSTMESFVNLSPYIKRIVEAGGDPDGFYELKVYFDGQLAGSIEFQIR